MQHVEVLPRVKAQFADREIVYLTLAINTINALNRLRVGFGTSPEGADAVFEMLHGRAANGVGDVQKEG